MSGTTSSIDPPTPTCRCAFELDAAHEAHEPPEARGVRRDDVRLMVSHGDDAADARHVSSRCPNSCRAGRPRRGQHVGHDSRRDRRRCSPDDRTRSSCTSRPNCRAGSGWSSRGSRSRRCDRATQPRRRTGAAIRLDRRRPRSHLLRPAPRISHRLVARRRRRRRRDCRRDAAGARPADPLPVRRAGLAARRLPDRVRRPSRAAPRCRARRGRSATELVTRARPPRRRRRADHVAHRRVVARRPRAARTPSAPKSAATAARSTRCTRPAGMSSPSAPPWSAALETTVDRRQGIVHPGDGWTDVVDHTASAGVRAVDGLLTGLARARGDAPRDARGVAGRAGARRRVRGSVRRGLPVARVRRQPPVPSVRWAR